MMFFLYKTFNTNQSYSIKLFVCKVLKLLVVSTPEHFELILEYIFYHSGAYSSKPVYTRSIETKRYTSKNKIGIRLRSCTNLSGRK